MSQDISLVVGAEISKEIDARIKGKLIIPSDAIVKGSGDRAVSTWVELLSVGQASVGPDKNRPKEVIVFTVTYRIPNDSPYPTNIGNRLTEWYRVNPGALKAAKATDDQSDLGKQQTMSFIALGTLKKLLLACGYVVDDDTDYAAFFNGERPAIAGSKFYGRIKDKMGTDQDGNPEQKQTIVKFVSEGDLGSL